MHDYLTQRGGAERVVLSMARAFPDAPVYTSLYEPGSTFPEFRDVDVRPLWTNRSATLRRDHRKGLLLYPAAFSLLTVDAAVVLCSSSGFAHGVRTTGRKVVYCYTPARWLYDEAPTYLAGVSPPARAALRAAAPALRGWDRRAAHSADRYLTTSTSVAARIKRVYDIDAEVVPAPVPNITSGPREPVAALQPGFVLSVGRLLPYKNVDVVVQALAQLPDQRLVVVGEGSERARLEQLAGSNVTFVGQVTDAQLRWLYESCVGVVSASHEDYGLTPLEANSFGKPSAVLRAGGFLDTVLEGKTGVFFDVAAPAPVAESLRTLDAFATSSSVLRAHCGRFAEERFAADLQCQADAVAVGGDDLATAYDLR